MDTHDRVRKQFGPTAKAYGTSPSHANPVTLASLCELVKAGPHDVALDVATGAGNMALALAPHVRRVVASDLTPEMIAETARRAAEMGLVNVETSLAAAESLPFPDASFTLVTCRVAPHHFADIRKAIHEMARVIAPGGRLMIQDTSSPDDDTLDREINEIEKLRDPSHVRNYRPSEWRAFVAAEGLTITHFQIGRYDGGQAMPVGPWLERIRATPQASAEVWQRLRSASPALREALQFSGEGDELGIVLPQVTLVGERG